jgi:hypothetical protein
MLGAVVATAARCGRKLVESTWDEKINSRRAALWVARAEFVQQGAAAPVLIIRAAMARNSTRSTNLTGLRRHSKRPYAEVFGTVEVPGPR